MTNWDYAQLSHLAKELGGPQALITSIRDGGLATGRWQGGIIGTVVTLAIGGLGAYLYVRHQKTLALANTSAEVLEANINAHDAHTDEASEGDGNDDLSRRSEKLDIEDIEE